MLKKNVESTIVREITFRGSPRDGNRGTYVYGQFFFDNHEGEPIPSISTRTPGGTLVTEVLGESVSEGTGKRDSAGREVYEGDTLQDEEGNSYIVEREEEEVGFYLFQEASARTFYFPDIKQFWVSNPQDSAKEVPSEE
jgi:hypothetical protein